MPVYEYTCPNCDTRFELLRSMSQADAPTCCPECNAEGAKRALSRFASFSRSSDGSVASVGGGGGCASCAGGSCAGCGHH